MLISTDFTLEKETKGAVRYKEDQENYAIGTLYLRKDALSGPPYPARITVTVETSE